MTLINTDLENIGTEVGRASETRVHRRNSRYRKHRILIVDAATPTRPWLSD